MSDVISNAKEVYKKFRRLDGTTDVVPIRGMYVTGVWQPPEYMEPALHLLSFKRTHVNIEDYIERSVSTTDMGSVHLYDAGLDTGYRIDWYSQASAPTQSDMGSVHLYDAGIDTGYRIDWYTSGSASITDRGSVHLYDANVDFTHVTTFLGNDHCGSHPEPILRLIEFNRTGITIENIN